MRRPGGRFRMPAEWERHAATWIAWPHNREDWPGRFAPIPWVYGEIVRQLSRVERVRILVENRAIEEQARRVLGKVGAQVEAVEFFACPTNRSWTRDSGPIFVQNRRGEVALTAWRFNARTKYDDWRKDALVPAHLARRLRLPLFPAEMVLEVRPVSGLTKAPTCYPRLCAVGYYLSPFGICTLFRLRLAAMWGRIVSCARPRGYAGNRR